MEPILLLIEGWWWVAPAAVGVGAATYSGLTVKTRRARRLELDAARHEEGVAYRGLLNARAVVGAAKAGVASARSQSGAPIWDVVLPATPETYEARQRLAEARRAERAAALALQATRSRVRAAVVQYHATSTRDPLPIERLWSTHDAVNARWLAYDTDPGLAIDYPQMADARHPATLAFLRAQREAQSLRPWSTRTRIEPADFVAYRDSVHRLEAALREAERQAGVGSAARG